MNNIIDKTNKILLLHNYSPKTRKSYLFYINNYITFSKKHKIKNKKKAIESFLLDQYKRKLSPQTISLSINAIKFLYKEILDDQQTINFKFAKKSKKLPVILSREEIKKLINVTTNPKHKLILALAYSSGLKVSEVINIRIADININELIIHIKNDKGKKDRITILSEKLINNLKILINNRKMDDYLFLSSRKSKLSTTSLQKIFKNSLKKAKIKKKATFHSLRHSFATHLLENGTSIRYIQELLGHSNIRTTQLYTKVVNPKLKNIKSPL